MGEGRERKETRKEREKRENPPKQQKRVENLTHSICTETSRLSLASTSETSTYGLQFQCRRTQNLN
jgi:hypothetical protein